MQFSFSEGIIHEQVTDACIGVYLGHKYKSTSMLLVPMAVAAQHRFVRYKHVPTTLNTAIQLRYGTSICALQVLVYHGSKRAADLEALESADVVLTTYSVLENEYRK
jgi:hypothetical protein